MSKWISVDIEMPEKLEEVIVFCKWDNSCLIAFHDGVMWTEKCDNLDIVKGDALVSTKIHEVGAKDIGCEITHWQPMLELPDPPAKQG